MGRGRGGKAWSVWKKRSFGPYGVVFGKGGGEVSREGGGY